MHSSISDRKMPLAVVQPGPTFSARVGYVSNGRESWWRTVTRRTGDRMKVTGAAICSSSAVWPGITTVR